MKIKRLFFTGLTFLLLTCTLQAQNYNTSLGVRLGYDSGIAFKYITITDNAAEFILSASPRYFQLTGLYEHQRLVPGSSDLSWVVGVGGHLGNIHYDKHKYKSSFLLGFDLLAGLEYGIAQTPYAISLDWKPAFNIINSDYNDYWFSGFAVSLRYRLN